MVRKALFLCVLFVIYGNLTVLAQQSPVTACDTYAASPSDPHRKSAGVPFDKLDPAIAIPACTAAARKNPADARLLYQLGRSYLKANNFREAAGFFKGAAQRGYAAAKNDLAYMYERGLGVNKDLAEAQRLLRQAAAQGYSIAQVVLGAGYEHGAIKLPRDIGQAIFWYKKAVEQGDQNAVASIRRLANEGNAIAELNLGAMYEHGNGISKNLAEAVIWYSKAAEQENQEAIEGLRRVADQGSAAAIKWLQNAERQAAIKAEAARLRAETERIEAEKQAAIKAEDERVRAEAARVEAERQAAIKAEEAERQAVESEKRGLEYARKRETTWNVTTRKNEMTDKVDVSGVSIQKNDQGALAEIRAICEKNGLSLSALIVDSQGKPTVSLPWRENIFSLMVVPVTVRVDDLQPTSSIGIPGRYANEVLLKSFTAAELRAHWRYLFQFNTSMDQILIKIPVFDENIQKLIKSCS